MRIMALLQSQLSSNEDRIRSYCGHVRSRGTLRKYSLSRNNVSHCYGWSVRTHCYRTKEHQTKLQKQPYCFQVQSISTFNISMSTPCSGDAYVRLWMEKHTVQNQRLCGMSEFCELQHPEGRTVVLADQKCVQTSIVKRKI